MELATQLGCLCMRPGQHVVLGRLAGLAGCQLLLVRGCRPADPVLNQAELGAQPCALSLSGVCPCMRCCQVPVARLQLLCVLALQQQAVGVRCKFSPCPRLALGPQLLDQLERRMRSCLQHSMLVS